MATQTPPARARPSQPTKTPKPWACSSCTDTFKTTARLRNHEILQHGIEPPRAAIAKTKMAARPAVQKRRCDECEDEFLTQRMLNVHVRVMHQKVPCHTCPHCGGLYGHSADLSAHILRDHDSSTYEHKCAECTCAFKTSFQLRQHTLNAHRRELLRCSQCEYETAFSVLLERHVACHRNEDTLSMCEGMDEESSSEIDGGSQSSIVQADGCWSGARSTGSRTHTEMMTRRIGYIVVPRQN